MLFEIGVVGDCRCLWIWFVSERFVGVGGGGWFCDRSFCLLRILEICVECVSWFVLLGCGEWSSEVCVFLIWLVVVLVKDVVGVFVVWFFWWGVLDFDLFIILFVLIVFGVDLFWVWKFFVLFVMVKLWMFLVMKDFKKFWIGVNYLKWWLYLMRLC